LAHPNSAGQALLGEKIQHPESIQVWKKSLKREQLDFKTLTIFVIFLPGLTFRKCAFN
jgi:hypothetical protein